MTARTFGRRGMADPGPGAISTRRAALLGNDPAPAREADEIAAKREAFLAAERAQEAVSAREPLPRASEEQIRAVLAGPDAMVYPPTDRSLRIAYALWFVLGLAGAHRLYLRRPLSGGLQATIFLGCWGATLAQYYWAFAGLAVTCVWMMIDGFLLKTMHDRSGRQ
jgi:TM2 domain-containing membrane protein YozV